MVETTAIGVVVVVVVVVVDDDDVDDDDDDDNDDDDQVAVVGVVVERTVGDDVNGVVEAASFVMNSVVGLMVTRLALPSVGDAVLSILLA